MGRLPQNHPMYKKAQHEISKVQSKIVRYYVLLLQDELTIHSTVKLLDLLLELLPGWLGCYYDPIDGSIMKEQ